MSRRGTPLINASARASSATGRKRGIRDPRLGATGEVVAEGDPWDAVRFHASLLSEIPNGVVSTDAHGEVTYCNLVAEEMTGRTAAEALGMRAPRFVGMSDQDYDIVRAEVQRNGRWTGEAQLARVDGTEYPASISVVALSLEPGDAYGELIVWSDMTDRVDTARHLAAAYAQLELLLGAGPAVIYSDRPEPGFPNVFTTPNVRAVLGLDPEDVGETRFVERIHPADRARVVEGLSDLLATGRSLNEYRFRHGDGSYHWIRDENTVVVGADGTPVEIVGYLADITDQHRIAEDRVRLAAAMDQTTDGVVMSDPSGVITYANASFCEMSGRSADDLIGSSGSELAHGPLAAQYEAAIRTALRGERWTGSAIATWRADRPVDLDIAVWPLMIDGEVANLVGVFRDATVERRLGAALRQHVDQRDALVQSFARLRSGATVEETAAAVCAELIAVAGIDVATVVGFVNGTGVARLAGAGDLDSDLGRLFEGCCGSYFRTRASRRRLEDTDQHLAAHREGCCTWSASRLRALHLEPLVSDGMIIGVLAMGSGAPDAGPRMTELAAYFGEYAAVAAALIAPGWANRRRSSDLAATIHEIVATRSFRTVFQPARELSMRAIVGYEALTRFDDGTGPDVQFAQAASVSLGVDLEEATLASAIEQAARLPAGPWLSLNVSPTLVTERGRLARLLRDRGERTVVLEITEHAVVDDYGALRRVVKGLGEGIEIAVDDAGAGFASLRHIAELRPSYVKLDMGLVRGVARDPARQGLIAGMVHFAIETGCVLIAEGIETEAEFRALRRLGVTFGQGYLLGRPRSLDDDVTR